MFIARNLVWLKKWWVWMRKISKRKKRDDDDLYIYDKDVNNTIKKFVKTQDNHKYYLN